MYILIFNIIDVVILFIYFFGCLEEIIIFYKNSDLKYGYIFKSCVIIFLILRGCNLYDNL